VGEGGEKLDPRPSRLESVGISIGFKSFTLKGFLYG
jgi:hypothetical protein